MKSIMILRKQIIFLPGPMIHVSESRRGTSFCSDFTIAGMF